MKKFINRIKVDTKLSEHQFFGQLKSGKLKIDDFIRVQESFYHVVRFISRAMLAVAANIDSYNLRWKIIENIIDEHGSGDVLKNHEKTYIDFLNFIGSDSDRTLASKPHKAAIKFNQKILDECQNGNWIRSVSMIGIMEDRFIEISNITILYTRSIGLISKDTPHYRTHEDIDVKHADDFYSIVLDKWSNKDDRKIIKSGLLDGNTMFLDLFRDLLIK